MKIEIWGPKIEIVSHTDNDSGAKVWRLVGASHSMSTAIYPTLKAAAQARAALNPRRSMTPPGGLSHNPERDARLRRGMGYMESDADWDITPDKEPLRFVPVARRA